MSLNPFDWRGPEFLLFYLALAAGTLFLVWWWRRVRESGDIAKVASLAQALAQDPYQVAFLRGGRYEMLHVAVVSLLERGLLKANGEFLRTVDPAAADKARRSLDKAILTKFASQVNPSLGRKADLIYTDQTILAEADLIGEHLSRQGLLPDAALKAQRKNRIAVAAVFLWAIAGTKIVLALMRGHYNVFFLLVLAVLFPLALILVSRRFRTVLGDQAYHQIQDLFISLRQRRNSLELNQTSSELTFLAAAFGLAALPSALTGAVLSPLHLHPPKPVGHYGSSGCGSSCASFSSCGSSGCGGGGGSCGGGCGGGCGGCGG